MITLEHLKLRQNLVSKFLTIAHGKVRVWNLEVRESLQEKSH